MSSTQSSLQTYIKRVPSKPLGFGAALTSGPLLKGPTTDQTNSERDKLAWNYQHQTSFCVSTPKPRSHFMIITRCLKAAPALPTQRRADDRSNYKTLLQKAHKKIRQTSARKTLTPSILC